MSPPPNRIRRLRKHEKVDGTPMTLKQLADRIGVAESTMCRYELGQRAIPDGHKRALAAIFEVTVAYVMRWDSDAHGDNGEREAAA